MKFIRFCLFIIGFAIPVFCFANDTIRVGLPINTPPFVTENNGVYGGIAVDFWNNIATNENIKFTYVPLSDNIDEDINKLYNKEIDVLIGPISITHARFQLVDFSRPFFLNHVALIEHRKRPDIEQLLLIFWEIFKSPFILIFLLYFFIYVHLLWLFERKTNENVPKTYGEGMSYVFWLHLRQNQSWTLPRSIPGRIAAFSWFITAGLFITSITAAVTSKLTLALVVSSDQFKQSADLFNKRVATIEGESLIEIAAKKWGAKVIHAKDMDEAAEWLMQKKVAAIIQDLPIARAFLDTHNYPQLQIASFVLANDELGFAFRYGSPLRTKIDNQMLLMQESDFARVICIKYVGLENAKNCSL